VAVIAVLTNGRHHVPVDMRLYLPKAWVEDPARCDRAGIPADDRKPMSKSGHALDIVQRPSASTRGLRFEWVSVDGGYGKEPEFLRALDDAREVFGRPPRAGRRSARTSLRGAHAWRCRYTVEALGRLGEESSPEEYTHTNLRLI